MRKALSVLVVVLFVGTAAVWAECNLRERCQHCGSANLRIEVDGESQHWQRLRIDCVECHAVSSERRKVWAF